MLSLSLQVSSRLFSSIFSLISSHLFSVHLSSHPPPPPLLQGIPEVPADLKALYRTANGPMQPDVGCP
jgi:hypothetical protein